MCKSYRGWKISYAPKARRFTATGECILHKLTQFKADSRVEVERRIDEYLAPITFSEVTVNGVPTRISSRQHVVKSIVGGQEVVEDKDTPLCCSVASETYWSM